MTRNDLILMYKLVVKKYDGAEHIDQSEIEDMRENINRLENLSPVDRRKELPKLQEKKARKLFKELGFSFTNIEPL